jgi:hypothetical protein
VQDKVYPPYDYGLHEYSRKIFKSRFGVDPIETEGSRSQSRLAQYRLDSVVDLVNTYLVPAAKAGGKKISAAVFPGPSLARTMVRQDWGRFQLDAYFPMLYHSFYQEGTGVGWPYTGRGGANGQVTVHSGMFVSPMTDDEFTRTIEQALSERRRRCSIFDAGRDESCAVGAARQDDRCEMRRVAIAVLLGVGGLQAADSQSPNATRRASARVRGLSVDVGPSRLMARLTEPVWLSADWTDPFVDIEGDVRRQPAYLTRVKMAWDDSNFYIGAYSPSRTSGRR